MGMICGQHPTVQNLMQHLYASQLKPPCAPPTRFKADLPNTYPTFCLSDNLADELTALGGTLTVGMACMAAREALSQAGLHLLPPNLRIGICIGSSTGASLNFSDHYFARKQNAAGNRHSMQMAIRQNPAIGLARRLDKNISGPFFTITNACSSSTDALGAGASLIRHRICDIVIAGGSDELSLIPYLGFIGLMVHDTEPCKPFDHKRAGLNLGEGAGILILESEDHLSRRNGKALSRLAGYGNALDAYHLTAPHPDGKGLIAAQQTAIKNAGISADDLVFINAHGTATRDNDKVESLVFKKMFPNALISATKGITGHTLGAAGAIEAIITVQCLLNGVLPPSPGFRCQDPELEISPVQQLTPITGSYAMSQSLAFGGQNAALIFCKE
jgi:3-oxoacyl-[acyl-carrier-protein] synthase-1/3-oxoacyl-[acyl-carrier-protein] synthase II